MQEDITEKLKNQQIKRDLDDFIEESLNMSRKIRPNQTLLNMSEFINILCFNAVRNYGFLASTVWDYWGIRNQKDIICLIKEFFDCEESDINLNTPINNKNYFLNVLNPKNIGLTIYKTNGDKNIGIKLYLKNDIDIES